VLFRLCYSQLAAFVGSWRGGQGKPLRAFVPLTFALGEGKYQWHQVSKMFRNHWYRLTVQAETKARISEAVLMVDREPRLQQLPISEDAETIIT
jgi:hypothetical protein